MNPLTMIAIRSKEKPRFAVPGLLILAFRITGLL
jgi:hypothetical protein